MDVKSSKCSFFWGGASHHTHSLSVDMEPFSLLVYKAVPAVPPTSNPLKQLPCHYCN